MSRQFIGYPTDWTLAVMDEAAEAEAAGAELLQLGVPPEDVVVMAGHESIERMRRLGTSTGFPARLRRAVQFVTMDQLPDLHVYETALDDRHPVVGVRVADAVERRRAIEVLRGHGAHFINRFGAWATEEIAPWRGRMPERPQHMMR
jgi:hypothetical protein